MGFCVNVLVTFDAEKEKAVVAASEALSELPPDAYFDSLHVLRFIAQGHGWTEGCKGAVFAVAYTGNYARGEKLVEGLMPFARKLFLPGWKGTPNMDKLTVITQNEQTSVSQMFTIHPSKNFAITVLELPVVWHEDY